MLIGSIVALFLAVILFFVAFVPSLAAAQQQQQQQTTTTPSPPAPTLPFTPFSLQQEQEAVPEEEEGGGEGEPTQGPGIPPSLLLTNDTGTGAATTTPATNDTVGEGIAELAASSSEPPLRVEAIANTTQAYAPATIRFDANITGGAPPYTYNWYVPGFGVIDQDRSITQMFFEPGTFNYILTVTDSRGKVLTDNVPIVIYERLSPPGGEGVTVAPEPGGVATPEEPIQEPGVPPPTVGEGGDTGRGPQGGVTVGEGGGPIQEPGTPPPTVPEGQGGGGGISIGEGGFVLIPNATSGYVGDRFELQIYIRDNIEIEHPIVIFCLSHVPQNGICNTSYYVQERADCDLSGVPPPGYRAFSCVGAFWYSTPGTHRIIFGTDTRNIGSTQITIKEQPPQGGAVAPEPGGVAPPEEGGGLGVPPSLLPNNTGTRAAAATTTTATNDTVTPAECPPGQFFNATSGQCELLVGEDVVAPEPGGVAPPPTNDTVTPTESEGEGVLLPPETGGEGQPPGTPALRAQIITNATQAITNSTQAFDAPATIRFDAEITGGAPPYSYSWYLWSPTGFELIEEDRSLIQTFLEPGTFTYALTARDSLGSASDYVQIVITEQGVLLPPETGGEGQPPGALFSPGIVPPPLNDTEGEVISPPAPPDVRGAEEEARGGEQQPSETGDGEEQEEPSAPPPPPDDTEGEGEGTPPSSTIGEEPPGDDAGGG